MISKKWLKRAGGAYLVVATTVAAWLFIQRAWVRSKGERELGVAVAETDALDPGWRWDVIRTGRSLPPAGTDSTPIRQQFINSVSHMWAGEWVKRGRRMTATVLPPANTRFAAATLDEVRDNLVGVKHLLDLLRQMKDFPLGHVRDEHFSPERWRVAPRLGWWWLASDLLRWDAVFAVEGGDAELAVENLFALLNVSRSIGDAPCVLYQSERMGARLTACATAEWVLAQQQPPAAALARLQAVWAADAEEPLLLIGLRGDRARADHFLAALCDGWYGDGQEDVSFFVAGEVLGRHGGWFSRVRFLRVRAAVLEWMTRAVEAAKLPHHEQLAAFAALADPPGVEEREAKWLLPRPKHTGLTYLRTVAHMRTAAVAFACERFRLKTGRWPESLGEIPPDILPAVPLDPFDGKPLRYKKYADGIVVYSVGENGIDDGGDIARDKPGPDEGFRLWNPDQRRLPPIPKPTAEVPNDP